LLATISAIVWRRNSLPADAVAIAYLFDVPIPPQIVQGRENATDEIPPHGLVIHRVKTLVRHGLNSHVYRLDGALLADHVAAPLAYLVAAEIGATNRHTAFVGYLGRLKAVQLQDGVQVDKLRLQVFGFAPQVNDAPSERRPLLSQPGNDKGFAHADKLWTGRQIFFSLCANIPHA